MFIIHMNDIGSAIKYCEYYLFADDTYIVVCDLEKLSKWLKRGLKFNKLKLNVRKTRGGLAPQILVGFFSKIKKRS
jgi:hypothetical protein